MAELNESSQNAGGKHKRKKSSTRIDLTAMVDLAFLLITFFIMTTTLTKPKAMDLTMPDDEGENNMPVPASRTLTILLGKDSKAMYYLGELKNPIIAPAVTDFSTKGMRKAIIETNKKVHDASGGKTMIVLVKPSDKSQYSSLVNTLDELNITGIQQHAIVDIMPDDVEMLKQKGI